MSRNEFFKIELKNRIYDNKLNVLKVLDSLDNRKIIDRRIGDQLVRSIISITANYVEGQAGCSKKDFENFINHSLMSSNESLMWLKILKDLKKIETVCADEFIKEKKEISNMLASILINSRKR